MIAHFYYYLYFNAYWASFDIGEKSVPRQNATYYMTLLKIFLLSSISFTLSSLGFKINLGAVIGLGFLGILIMNNLLLSEKIFEEKFETYEFIKSVTKKKRLWMLFGTIAFAGILNVSAVFFFASR